MKWEEAAVRVMSRVLGTGVSSRCVASVLSFALRLASPRRSVAMRNIARALPDASEKERARILRETYEHIVWTGIETIVLQRDPRRVLDWFEAGDVSLLDELSGKGAILLTGHVGNWEITAAWIAQRGHDITAIVRESDDESERGLIERMREHVGVKCLPKTAPMTRSIAILRRGAFLGILPDQHGGPNGIRAEFFGVPTSTSQGAAVFAYLTKKPLVPVFSHRVAPFRHVIRVGPAIEWRDRVAEDAPRDEVVFAMTRMINESVERMVREAPGQWLAQHRRFRELDEQLAR